MSSLPLSIINTIEKQIRTASSFQYISSDKTDEIVDALTQISVRSGMAVYIWLSNSGLVNIKSRQTPLPGTKSVLEALKYAKNNHYFAVYVFPGVGMKELLEIKSTLPQAGNLLVINDNFRLLFLINENVNFNYLTKNAEEIELLNKNIKKYKLRNAQWILSDG